MGRCRPRHPSLRARGAEREGVLDRRRRPHPGRRDRLPGPTVRVDHRQPAGRRRGARRRHDAHRGRRSGTRTCSGRCAAEVATSVSSPRSRSGSAGPQRGGRSDVLAGRASEEVMRLGPAPAEAPENLNGWFGFLTVPTADAFPAELPAQGGRDHLVSPAATRPCRRAMRAAARALPEPLLDGVGEMPRPALQSTSIRFTLRDQWYWRADYVDELTDEAIAIHAEYGRAPDLAVDDAPLSRSTVPPSASVRGDGLGPPPGEVGPGDRGRRPRPRQPGPIAAGP